MPSPKRVASITPFAAALDGALKGRWRGKRNWRTLRGQASAAIRILEADGCECVEDVLHPHLSRLCDVSLKNGVAHSTVRYRLACLSVLGVQCQGFHFKVIKPRRWFLRPEDERRLAHFPELSPTALAFIHWTCCTGLRIEETLRLRWRDIISGIVGNREVWMVNVPGTKTEYAEATLPLSEEATGVLQKLEPSKHAPSEFIFPMAYLELRAEWQKCRRYLELEGVPTATLKALRRSFARRAHLKGMPIDVLRQYLRHNLLTTTQGYLHLVGGYNQDEMARYL